MAAARGALIVLEGCDRAGKTTQAKKLVEALNQLGRVTKLLKFPGKYCELMVCSSGDSRPDLQGEPSREQHDYCCLAVI